MLDTWLFFVQNDLIFAEAPLQINPHFLKDSPLNHSLNFDSLPCAIGPLSADSFLLTCQLNFELFIIHHLPFKLFISISPNNLISVLVWS